MSEMAARYDLRARSYGRCWAPVLAPAALGLLDAIEPGGGTCARQPGCSTPGRDPGRWRSRPSGAGPGVHVVGLDVSSGMLAVARAAAERDARRRGPWAAVARRGKRRRPGGRGPRGRLVDAAVSSFVLHLVPDRAAGAGRAAARAPTRRRPGVRRLGGGRQAVGHRGGVRRSATRRRWRRRTCRHHPRGRAARRPDRVCRRGSRRARRRRIRGRGGLGARPPPPVRARRGAGARSSSTTAPPISKRCRPRRGRPCWLRSTRSWTSCRTRAFTWDAPLVAARAIRPGDG